MLANALCPYCSVQLIKAENQPNSRSVEHLIPNTVLRIKRKNDEGDFLACRQCNSRKSHIDYILGVVTKGQSRDDEFAIESLTRAINRDGGSSERFVQMVAEAELEAEGGAHMRIPISGPELLEYIYFLGKGQYFRKRGRIYDRHSQVMIVQFANKHVHSAFEIGYGMQYGTNPFRDLELNAGSEVISNGDCIIWSKNDNYFFVFHDYTSIGVQVKRRNRKNSERERLRNAQMLEDFKSSPRATAA